MTAAVDWLIAMLLGTVGTSIAVIAIAVLGFAMLQGRMPVRRGAIIVMGCFILFSSQTIAAGLLKALSAAPEYEVPVSTNAPPAYVAPSPPPVAYDPYAGASVPVRPRDGASDLILR